MNGMTAASEPHLSWVAVALTGGKDSRPWAAPPREQGQRAERNRPGNCAYVTNEDSQNLTVIDTAYR